jgi:hypothetical protein
LASPLVGAEAAAAAAMIAIVGESVDRSEQRLES